MNQRLLNAYLNKGTILDKMGRNEEALASLNKVLDLTPDHEKALFIKANLLFKLGKHDEALKCIDKINVNEIEDPTVKIPFLKQKAASRRVLEDNEGAYATYKEIVEIDQSETETWHNMLSLLKEMGKSEESLECYDNILMTQPEDLIMLREKAAVLYELGRLEEALAQLKNITAGSSQDNDSWKLRYEISKKLKDMDEMIVAIDHLLETDPKNIQMWHERLRHYEPQGDLEETLKCCDAVLELAPNNTVIWNKKIEILKTMNRLAEALQCIDELKMVKQHDYKKVLREAWQDGVLTEKEKRLIEELRRQIDIPFEEHKKIENGIKKELKLI